MSMMNVNQRLKKARKTLKITQKEFAKSIYVSPSFVADIETEYRNANDRIIKLASMVFGISENWLKTGEGEMFYKSPDEKITRLVSIFNELPADFQNYALQQLDQLLELRRKQKNPIEPPEETRATKGRKNK